MTSTDDEGADFGPEEDTRHQHAATPPFLPADDDAYDLFLQEVATAEGMPEWPRRR